MITPSRESPLATELYQRSLGQNIGETTIAEVTLPVVSTLVVFLRLYLRKTCNITIRWSDYAIVGVLPFYWIHWGLWAYISTNVIPRGLQGQSPEKFEVFMKFFYGVIVASWPMLFLLKCSVLFFYLEAFGTTRRTRYVLYGLFAFQVANFLIRAFGSIFSCSPVTAFWTDISKCPHLFTFYVISESFNLFSELVLFIFPVPIVWNLHIDAQKKAGVIACFAVGGAAFAASLYRFYEVESITYGTASIQDTAIMPTIEFCNLFEVGIGIIAACLPAMHRPLQSLLKSLLNRYRGSSSAQSALDTSSENADPRLCEGNQDEKDLVVLSVETTERSSSV